MQSSRFFHLNRTNKKLQANMNSKINSDVQMPKKVDIVICRIAISRSLCQSDVLTSIQKILESEYIMSGKKARQDEDD